MMGVQFGQKISIKVTEFIECFHTVLLLCYILNILVFQLENYEAACLIFFLDTA